MKFYSSLCRPCYREPRMHCRLTLCLLRQDVVRVYDAREGVDEPESNEPSVSGL